MIKIIFPALLTLTSVAQAQTRIGNGGDICEDRIKIIRDDITSWLGKGGAVGLDFPKDVSLQIYSFRMDNSLRSAAISCTDSVIRVGTAEKTCKNVLDQVGRPQLICNTDRFSKTAESDQYVLIHHEYAGLADLEVNDSDGSNYFISNQIAGYLEKQTIRKLSIQRSATSAILTCKQNRPQDALASDFDNLIVRSSLKKVSFEFTIPAHPTKWGPTTLHDSLRAATPEAISFVVNEHAYKVAYEAVITEANPSTTYCGPFNARTMTGHCQIGDFLFEGRGDILTITDLTIKSSPFILKATGGIFGVNRITDESGDSSRVTYRFGGQFANPNGIFYIPFGSPDDPAISFENANCKITH